MRLPTVTAEDVRTVIEENAPISTDNLVARFIDYEYFNTLSEFDQYYYLINMRNLIRKRTSHLFKWGFVVKVGFYSHNNGGADSVIWGVYQ